MSANLDPKDKALVFTNFKKGEDSGKIHLDAEDSKSITEMFSRLSPGDEVSFHAKATLDDAGEKVVTLSIKEIEFDEPDEDDAPPADDDGETPESDEPPSAAVTMMKGEDGVPTGDDNDVPPDSMPHAV
jgi:hypothetical protein